jgi:hypothetical protein
MRMIHVLQFPGSQAWHIVKYVLHHVAKLYRLSFWLLAWAYSGSSWNAILINGNLVTNAKFKSIT